MLAGCWWALSGLQRALAHGVHVPQPGGACCVVIQEIRVVVLGFIRPEMRFPGGFPELLNRIKLDIAVGTAQAAAWGDGAALLDG